MTKKMSTKRALISSLLVMAMCFSMLVGSTFAWFTDSVTSSGNRILSGTLDIDLLMYKGNDGYVSIAGGSGDIFNEAEVAQNSTATLWEPGKTQVAFLGVKNEGSLAVKYNILLNISDIAGYASMVQNDFAALEYAIIEGQQYTDVSGMSWDAVKALAGNNVGDVMLGQFVAAQNGQLDEIVNGTADETQYFALAVHMKETAGNEFQNAGVQIDMTVIATQLSKESDSFGIDYDANAKFASAASTTAVVPASKNMTISAAATPATSETSTVVEFTGVDADENAQVVLNVETENVINNAGFTAGDIAQVSLSLETVGAGAANVTFTSAKVTTYISKGLTNPTVTYGEGDSLETWTTSAANEAAVAGYVAYYDADTGKLVFVTTHFSDYTVKSDDVAYVESKDKVYTSINDAIAAFGGSDDTIYLLKDVNLNNVLLIGKSVTINGKGHEITNTANRVIRITTSNLDVRFYNTKIISKCTDTSDVRGISFDNASAGSKLLLDGCTVSASFYAINAIPGADGIEITVKNGTVAAGWAAFNLYSNNSTFIVEDSTLSGLNDKGENEWNNFNTITFDGNSLWSDANIGHYGSGNTLSIKNSVVNASSESGNTQYWLGIQYGALNNTVTVDSATRIVNDNSEDMSGIFKVGYYCNYQNGNWTYYENGSNSITIGGAEVNFYKYTAE